MPGSVLVAVAAAASLVLAGGTPVGHTDRVPRAAREVLPARDGWASEGTGTTGGSAADAAHTFVVRDRAGLLAALGDGSDPAPRIVVVEGRVDLMAGASCDDFADPEYSLTAYLQAFDPQVWGRDAKPSGPLEEARARSAANQGRQIRIPVPANTTLVGAPGARIEHGSLIVNAVDNVIVRDIAFTDAADCFPSWDPTDGDTGNWNSLYDLVSLTTATHVWIEGNAFSDGDNPDADQPLYFGRPYQVHDGATDITRASDLVTVEHNDYHDHDKTMLIGSTDTVGADVGKLRVTVHHNRFLNALQRLPRVRFGQVDVYNNYYVATAGEFSYALGVGVQSSIHAQNNYFVRADGTDLIKDWKGTRISTVGNVVRTPAGGPARPVDLVAEYNATHDPDLSPDAGWTPVLRGRVDPGLAVPYTAGRGR